MPLAKDVAAKLRKLADAFEQHPQLEVKKPFIYMDYTYLGDNAKKLFLALGRILPRPLEKKYGDTELHLIYSTDSLLMQASIARSLVCTLVEPAKPAVYNCPPLFKDEEVDSI